MTAADEKTKSEIICTENGPYIVKNISQMTGTDGELVTTKITMALCRCGESTNKPYCDGTHSKIGFSSAVDPDRTKNRKRSYQGEQITVHDNRGLCAHAGICIRDLDRVFRLKKSPWIDPDQATVEEVKSVVDKCPSGALSYSIGNSETGADYSEQVTLRVIPSGPYKITGHIDMGNVEEFEGACDTRRTLCRCGHSKNKPYCDGAHLNVNFQDG